LILVDPIWTAPLKTVASDLIIDFRGW